MPIVVQLDVMLARRKMRSRELAERIGITEQNLSLLKGGKVRGVRFDTLAAICSALQCQPGELLSWEPEPEAASDRRAAAPDPGAADQANEARSDPPLTGRSRAR